MAICRRRWRTNSGSQSEGKEQRRNQSTANACRYGIETDRALEIPTSLVTVMLNDCRR